MTRRFTIAAWTTIVIAALISTCCARTWTDRMGKRFEGDFIALEDEVVKVKRNRDGKFFDIPLETLGTRTVIGEEGKFYRVFPGSHIQIADNQPQIDYSGSILFISEGGLAFQGSELA